MTFKEFCDNVGRAHWEGSFTLVVAVAVLWVSLTFCLVVLLVAAPGIGFSVVIFGVVARIIYAGLKGK